MDDVHKHISRPFGQIEYWFDYHGTEPVLPFIVATTAFQPSDLQTGDRHYYFWFFGYVAKLPWEREIEQQFTIEDLIGGPPEP